MFSYIPVAARNVIHICITNLAAADIVFLSITLPLKVSVLNLYESLPLFFQLVSWFWEISHFISLLPPARKARDSSCSPLQTSPLVTSYFGHLIIWFKSATGSSGMCVCFLADSPYRTEFLAVHMAVDPANSLTFSSTCWCQLKFICRFMNYTRMNGASQNGPARCYFLFIGFALQSLS